MRSPHVRFAGSRRRAAVYTAEQQSFWMGEECVCRRPDTVLPPCTPALLYTPTSRSQSHHDMSYGNYNVCLSMFSWFVWDDIQHAVIYQLYLLLFLVKPSNISRSDLILQGSQSAQFGLWGAVVSKRSNVSLIFFNIESFDGGPLSPQIWYISVPRLGEKRYTNLWTITGWCVRFSCLFKA